MDKRANNFDFLRVVLATLVIYSHSFALLLGSPTALRVETFRRFTRGQATGGEMAVDGFFVISGFLITQSWARRPLFWPYLQRRIARLYPGYLAAAVICLVVFAPLGGLPLGKLQPSQVGRFTLAALSLNYLDLPGVFPRNPITGAVNGSSWTIIYEFWCYLFLAACGRAFLSRRPVVFPVLLGVFVVLAQFPGHRYGDFRFNLPLVWEGQWPRLIGYFLAGASAYLYRDRVPGGVLPVMLAATSLVLCWGAGKGLSLVGPFAGSYLLLRFAFAPEVRLGRFAAKGDLSYGLYLYAFPVQQALVRFAGTHLNPYSLFGLSVAAVMPFATLSWSLVERPWLERKPR